MSPSIGRVLLTAETFSIEMVAFGGTTHGCFGDDRARFGFVPPPMQFLRLGPSAAQV